MDDINVSTIVNESWNGGYKLTSSLTSQSSVSNWELDFSLPGDQNIRAVYGAELNDLGGGNYSLTGDNLSSSQSQDIIFIVDGNSDYPALPQFNLPNSTETINSIDDFEISDSDSGDSDLIAIPDLPEASEPDLTNTEEVSTDTTGNFAYGEALQKNFLFFEANRSGHLPAENRLEWRNDATTNDGSDVGHDLNGGYFDAGDHIKFIQPMAFSLTMLAWGGVDYEPAYKKSGQHDELLESVKWGTDWLLKAHVTDDAGNTERLYVQVGDGSDHHYWVPPEEIASKTERPSFYVDASRPGSDVAAGSASALASASILFRGSDPAYANELLNNAKSLFDFAENHRGKYSDSVNAANPFYSSWSGDSDELVLAAGWLYRATGEKTYLEKAENYFKTEVGGLGDWSYATDNHSYAGALLLAKDSDDPFFKNQVRGWLNKWVNGEGSVNYSNAGFAHRANWASVPLALSAAYGAEWYHDHIEPNPEYSQFANDQVDYVLGDNPANLSYIVGFGEKYPKRVHHRGSAGTVPLDGSNRVNDNLLYGAVVGGPDSADDFSHHDRRDDWVTNEVGTSYNAPFAGAAIQQYDNLGGEPLSETELDQLIGIDADGTGL